jgi:phosphoribosylformylglycinamidine cyclo-ligase
MTSSSKPAGYDIDLGNECSRNAYGWAKKTFHNRDGKPGEAARDLDGGFANEVRFGAARLGISSDGIGTKIEVAERVDRFDTLGYDLVAMTADDLIVGGFVPTNLSNIIDVNTLSYDVIDELMHGLHDACNFAGIAITGGEIAELGHRIGGWPGARMNFNWCSTAIGSLHPSLTKPLSGAAVQPGMAVVAIHSPSFRSNGFSLARRTLQRLFGDDWHAAPYDGPDSDDLGNTWGEVLLASSLIYSPGVARVLDAGLPIHAAAHITGGGLADNFKRVLRNGVGAELDNLFAPLPAMQQLADLAEISPADAYLYWNMGNGMLLVTDAGQAEAVAAHLSADGYRAQVAGRITAEPGITLRVAAGELRYE